MRVPFHRRPTGWILLLGSLTLLGALLAILQSIHSNQHQITQLTQAGRELTLLHTLATTSANRGNLLLHALASQDPFERDQLISQFRAYGREHLHARQQLSALPAPQNRQTLFDQIRQHSDLPAQALNDMADRLGSEDMTALTALTPQARLQHLQTITGFQQLTEQQNQHVSQLLQRAAEELTHSALIITLLLALSFASLLLALRTARALQQQKDQLEEQVAARTHDMTLLIDHLHSEIASREALQQQLKTLAYQDPLTGLANRVLFMDRLEQTLAISQLNDQRFALLFMDLDDFKPINDTHGHAVGDDYLRTLAARWQSLLPATATLARLGGDEFALITPCMNSPERARELAELLLSQTRQAVTLPERPPLTTSVSIGIALYPQDGHTADLLLDHADDAMYCAKKEPQHGHICLYSDCRQTGVCALKSCQRQDTAQCRDELTATPA